MQSIFDGIGRFFYAQSKHILLITLGIMANEEQYKNKTLFVGTRGVQEYRASITSYVFSYDQVLEIGCEWGTTSELLYRRCTNLIATDVSAVCIKRAQLMRPQIQFKTLDVYDVQKAQKFGVNFTKMYIDVSGLSGYRSLLDVIALLEMYASVFSMQVIVIKSGSLKNFARRCIAWKG
jgi:hypothetical protein